MNFFSLWSTLTVMALLIKFFIVGYRAGQMGVS